MLSTFHKNQNNSLNFNKTISTFSALSRPIPQPFNIKQLQQNKQLMKNSKYKQFLSYLRTYNKKPGNQSQVCIIQKKLHQFLYTSLCICNNKTQQQAKLYLNQIDKWYEVYSKKRNLTIQYSSVKEKNEELDEQIRHTYKSNLPSNIQVYARQPFGITIKKEKAHKKNNKHRLGFQVLDRDSDKDSVCDFESDNQEKDKQTIIEKANLQKYRMEILKMKKHRQQKQENTLFQDINKNKSRLHSQTAMNFFKPFPHQPSTVIKQLKSQNKQNQTMPKFYNTSITFNQIKKNRLMNTLGKKPNRDISNTQDHLPTITSENEIQKQSILSVDGINLMKNPFEVTKKAKNKKKR